MERKSKKGTTKACQNCQALSHRIVSLERWKEQLQHTLKIYPLTEVLLWRKHITQWDTFLELYPVKKRISMVFDNILPDVPKDLVTLIQKYGNYYS